MRQENNHQREQQIAGMKIKFPSCFMAAFIKEI
jgi:hypothetical protein